MRNGLPRSLPSPGEPSLLRPARRACGTWLTKLESGHRVLESSRAVTSPNRQVGEGAAHPPPPPPPLPVVGPTVQLPECI